MHGSSDNTFATVVIGAVGGGQRDGSLVGRFSTRQAHISALLCPSGAPICWLLARQHTWNRGVRRRRRFNVSRKECCSTFQSQLEWTSGALQQCICRMYTRPRLQRSTVVDLRALQVCRQLKSWTMQSSRSSHHCVINDVVVFDGFNVCGQRMPRTQLTIPIPVLCEGVRSSTRQDLLDMAWPPTQCTQFQEHRYIHSHGRSG